MNNFEKVLASEVSRVPGATFEKVPGKKHAKHRIYISGQSRLVVSPLSCSDRRGILNYTATIRRLLREMTGAGK